MPVGDAPRVGTSAGRDVRRGGADVADRRAAASASRLRDRGPPRRGSSACSPVRRASTGRSSRRVRTTRWHGTISGTGLCPSAVPTARTAFGRPISAAIQPYGRTSPRGISRAFVQTSRSNAVWPRRSRSIRTRRSPSSRRRIAARAAGQGVGGDARRPVRAAWRAANAGVVGGLARPRTRRAVPGDEERPERASRSGRSGRRARPRRARRWRSWAGAAAPRRERPRRGRVVERGRSCGHLLGSSCAVRVERVRSMARPRWTWALTVPSGRSSAAAISA